MLVVGGGDSAIEAALACADEPGTQVVIAYRGEAFSRAKAANRDRLEAASAAGRRIEVLLETEIACIGAETVDLTCGGEPRRIANDAVIVQAGGVLPTELLRSIGVAIETKHGTA